MKLLKLLLFYSIMILLFSFCGKSPVNSQIDINKEGILFVRNFYELCLMRPDGSNIQVIGRHGYSRARWSPDKSKIVIAGDYGGFKDVFPILIMDINGKLHNRLTWNGIRPLWFHNGDRILYQEMSHGITGRLYSINIDGTDERLIYQVGDSTSFYLDDVSASEEYILGFESFYFRLENGKLSGTDNEIVKIHLETGKKMYLTDNELNDYAPKFNIDETMIAYFCIDVPGEVTVNNIENVYVMSSDGSNKRRVTNETMPNEMGPFLAWSPDSKKIAYCKLDYRLFVAPDGSDIFIIDILSGNVVNLTNTSKDGIYNKVMDWK